MVSGLRVALVVVCLAAASLALSVTLVASGASSAPSFSPVAAGGFHTCALTEKGGVKCWGWATFGQLGNGLERYDYDYHPIAVDVVGLASGVSEVEAGGGHTCALTIGGGAKCWGLNDKGQLGKGPQTSFSGSRTPLNVVGLSRGVSAIAAGGWDVCALTSGGGVKCWGANEHGQLGDGSTINRYTPVGVIGLGSGVKAVSAGNFHTCAVTTQGGAKCWGWQIFGQLGDGLPVSGTPGAITTPGNVAGLGSGVKAISAGGRFTCALTTAGGVKCWGDNARGELGNGSEGAPYYSTAADVIGLKSGVKAINAGDLHMCALMNVGGVKCWGANENGQLGDGSTTDRSVPVDVVGLGSGVKAISTGADHTCALMNGGGVKCWGNNSFGQLGNGSAHPAAQDPRDHSATPVDVLRFSPQAMTLRPSIPAGSISRGTTLTLRATVRPLSVAGSRATVRFEIYRKVGGVWRLASGSDVRAGATGQATLRWTFSTAGSWYVRAKALAYATYAASTWSPPVRYVLR